MKASLAHIRALALVLALVALVLCGAPRAIATPIEIELVYPEAASTSFGAAVDTFRALVASRSGGELRVVAHADGKWGDRVLDDIDMINEVRAGHVRMALVTSAHLSNLSPTLEVLNAPFIFESEAHVWRVLDGPIGDELLAAPVAQGVRGLAFIDGGFRIFACTRPVARLADFHGLRVRTLQNRAYVSLVKALGGVPVPASMNKIRAMVTRGFIDAADRSYPTYGDLNLYDLLRFVLETRHAYVAKVFIVNEPFFATLSPHTRAIIAQAARKAARAQRAGFRAETDAVKKRAVSLGVKIIALSAAERKAFEAATQVVRDEVVRLAGRDLVERVRAAASP